jgi:CheY-like chemotaxis protein
LCRYLKRNRVVITALQRGKPSTAVLVLSANLNPKNLKKPTKAGADEILDKFVTPSELLLGVIRQIGTREAADTP